MPEGPQSVMGGERGWRVGKGVPEGGRVKSVMGVGVGEGR